MKSREVDITELLFPVRELTPENQKVGDRKQELYRLACGEAGKKLRDKSPFSPLRLVRETEKIYMKYLKAEGLKYDRERGF